MQIAVRLRLTSHLAPIFINNDQVAFARIGSSRTRAAPRGRTRSNGFQLLQGSSGSRSVQGFPQGSARTHSVAWESLTQPVTQSGTRSLHGFPGSARRRIRELLSRRTHSAERDCRGGILTRAAGAAVAGSTFALPRSARRRVRTGAGRQLVLCTAKQNKGTDMTPSMGNRVGVGPQAQPD